MGRINNLEVIKWYNAADLFVLTSSGDTGPIVILEALRAGLPIISTGDGYSEIKESKKTNVIINEIKLLYHKIYYKYLLSTFSNISCCPDVALGSKLFSMTI